MHMHRAHILSVRLSHAHSSASLGSSPAPLPPVAHSSSSAASAEDALGNGVAPALVVPFGALRLVPAGRVFCCPAAALPPAFRCCCFLAPPAAPLRLFPTAAGGLGAGAGCPPGALRGAQAPESVRESGGRARAPGAGRGAAPHAPAKASLVLVILRRLRCSLTLAIERQLLLRLLPSLRLFARVDAAQRVGTDHGLGVAIRGPEVHILAQGRRRAGRFRGQDIPLARRDGPQPRSRHRARRPLVWIVDRGHDVAGRARARAVTPVVQRTVARQAERRGRTGQALERWRDSKV